MGRKNHRMLPHDIGHPICLCAKHKRLSNGGQKRWWTPPSCRVTTRGRRSGRSQMSLLKKARKARQRMHMAVEV
jgi:hypothetical protein